MDESSPAVSGVKWHSANIAPAAFCHIICSKWLQLLCTRVTNSEQYLSSGAQWVSIAGRTGRESDRRSGLMQQCVTCWLCRNDAAVQVWKMNPSRLVGWWCFWPSACLVGVTAHIQLTVSLLLYLCHLRFKACIIRGVACLTGRWMTP